MMNELCRKLDFDICLECEKKADECPVGFNCAEHCKEQGHGHCVTFGCGSTNIYLDGQCHDHFTSYFTESVINFPVNGCGRKNVNINIDLMKKCLPLGIFYRVRACYLKLVNEMFGTNYKISDGKRTKTIFQGFGQIAHYSSNYRIRVTLFKVSVSYVNSPSSLEARKKKMKKF